VSLAHCLAYQPPWRDGFLGWPGITCCSRLADAVEEAVSREEFLAVVAADRSETYQTTFCGQCYWSVWDRKIRPWADDPVSVIAPDAATTFQQRTGRRRRLAAELRALAALARAHPGEFTRLLEGELVLTALGGLP
jgi:hypothetical protein